jgi:hypothetical protein
MEPWTCKWCDFYNCLPPDDPVGCNRCEKRGTCYFHAGKCKKENCDNDTCYQCFKHFKYSDPEYDAPGITYDLALRAVKICLYKGWSDSSYEDPKDMMKELKSYEGKDLNDRAILSNCDEILWNCCAITDDRHVCDNLGHMLNQYDDIESCLCHYEKGIERKEKEIEKGLEKIHKDPDTFEVKGSKKGTSYLVNIEKRLCTCPGFKFQRNCKHIHMEKKPKKKK